MADTKFYHCGHCGNVVAVVSDGGNPPSCCGEPMGLLLPMAEGVGEETHVPVCEREGDHLVVRVGEARHDMVAEHLIEWIALECDGRLCFKFLRWEQEPRATFGVTASGRRTFSRHDANSASSERGPGDGALLALGRCGREGRGRSPSCGTIGWRQERGESR